MSVPVIPLTELLAGLSEPRWAARRQIVRALAERGDEALPGLFAELTSVRASETRIAAAMDALAASVGDADPGLLELAASTVPAIASDGAQILGRRRSLRAVPRLCELARAADDNVALAAIEALGKIGSPAAVETLLETLAHPDFFRSLPSLDALARLGDPRALGPLAARLDDRRFAAEAVRALGQSRDPAAVKPLVPLVGRGASALSRGVIAAIDQLRHEVLALYGSTAAIDAHLSAAGEAFLAGLLDALGGADDRVRGSIATLLGLVGDEGAVPDLLRLVDIGGPATIAAAGAALDRLGAEGRDALAARIARADAELGRALLPALSGGPTAGLAAARCLLEPNAELRVEAARFFARTRTPGFAEALFARLDDEQLEVAESALAALVALAEIDPSVPGLARAALAADLGPTRRAGLRILEELGLPDDGALVAQRVADPDATVRTAALRALSRDASHVGMTTRTAALGHHDPRTRAAAAQALEGVVADPAVRDALLAATADADGWVRYHATKSLARAEGPRVVSTIVKLLDDHARYVQLAAIAALGERTLAEAAAPLRARISGETDVRAAALVSLARLGDPGIAEAIRAELGTADAGTRVTLVGALAGLLDGGTEVLGALRAAAEDEDDTVRKVTVRALSARPDEGAVRVLLELLDGRSATLAQRALATPGPARIRVIADTLAVEPGPRAHLLAGALHCMGTFPALQALLGVLANGTEAGRAAAAKALRIADTTEARHALDRVRRDDPSAALRAIAAVR